jgi:hypothetical protein
MARPIGECVGGFDVGGIAHATLGALDPLLEREFLGFVEFLLAFFRLAQELESTFVLLVIEVI